MIATTKKTNCSLRFGIWWKHWGRNRSGKWWKKNGTSTFVHSNNSQAGLNGKRRMNTVGGQKRQDEYIYIYTLKDVKGSVSQFSGANSPDVNQWIEGLEVCALAVE